MMVSMDSTLALLFFCPENEPHQELWSIYKFIFLDSSVCLQHRKSNLTRDFTGCWILDLAMASFVIACAEARQSWGIKGSSERASDCWSLEAPQLLTGSTVRDWPHLQRATVLPSSWLWSQLGIDRSVQSLWGREFLELCIRAVQHSDWQVENIKYILVEWSNPIKHCRETKRAAPLPGLTLSSCWDSSLLLSFHFPVSLGPPALTPIWWLQHVLPDLPTVASKSSSGNWLSFAIAAVTNYQNEVNLKYTHTFLILQFWRSELWNGCLWAKNDSVSRLAFFLRLKRKICFLTFSSF